MTVSHHHDHLCTIKYWLIVSMLRYMLHRTFMRCQYLSKSTAMWLVTRLGHHLKFRWRRMFCYVRRLIAAALHIYKTHALTLR